MDTAGYRALSAWARREIRLADDKHGELRDRPDYSAGELNLHQEIGALEGRSETLVDLLAELREHSVDRDQSEREGGTDDGNPARPHQAAHS